MEKKFIDLAPKYFLEQGFSCSESIARAAVDMGLAEENFVSIATSFSGGMGSGCLCGAVAGAQMVIGLLFGKYQTNTARALAKEADIYIFDEPFANLDKETALMCVDVIKKETAGALTIAVLHDTELAERISDKVIYFK